MLLASVNDSLEEIGASALVQARGYPEKWGASFYTGDGAIERFADFATSPEVPRPQTWQVPRSDFDELLLRHAARCGADVREEHRVLDVVFDPDGVTLTYRDAAGGEHQTRAAAVVDASGRAGVLARKLDVRVPEPRLANIAIFSHYSGVPRVEGRRAGDIRIIARSDLGWFWVIPISDTLTSVGVVLPRAAYDALPRMEPADLLARTIEETPAAAAIMRTARREWAVRVEKDFSFGARTYAGDRWLLVGDAGSFLDPVFSTGVAIALESGVEAGRRARARAGHGRPVAARLRRVRPPPAPALSLLPPLRAGLLSPRLPRLVLPADADAADLPGRGHVPGRLLAPLAGVATLAALLFRRLAPPGVGAHRDQDSRHRHRAATIARRSETRGHPHPGPLPGRERAAERRPSPLPGERVG